MWKGSLTIKVLWKRCKRWYSVFFFISENNAWNFMWIICPASRWFKWNVKTCFVLFFSEFFFSEIFEKIRLTFHRLFSPKKKKKKLEYNLLLFFNWSFKGLSLSQQMIMQVDHNEAPDHTAWIHLYVHIFDENPFLMTQLSFVSLLFWVYFLRFK